MITMRRASRACCARPTLLTSQSCSSQSP
jgi:hypothetical protein